jgi:excisionase family DNA binding protein
MDPLEIFPKAGDVEQDAALRHPDPATTRLVLTIDEAAERLGIGRTLMAALVRSGDVESVRIGRLRRIPADALVEYVRSLRRHNPHEAA